MGPMDAMLRIQGFGKTFILPFNCDLVMLCEEVSCINVQSANEMKYTQLNILSNAISIQNTHFLQKHY